MPSVDREGEASYLSTIPGPSDHDDDVTVELYHLLAPPAGGTTELQQQTVSAPGHGHVDGPQHGFGGRQVIRQWSLGHVSPRCGYSELRSATPRPLSYGRERGRCV